LTGIGGNLWFIEREGNTIGRVTTYGVITEFPIPTAGSNSIGITSGPDGNLWFTESQNGRIARLTPAGVLTEFPTPTAFSGPFGITVGPDGNLWFTEDFEDNIGQLIITAKISGFVENAEGLPMSNVLVTLSGATTMTAHTDINGNYKFKKLTKGIYTVTPSKTGKSFKPTSITVTISGANVTGQNFTGRKVPNGAN
jgi:streptogramin lyase